MKEKIILILKWMIIGIANIIPWLSWWTMAVILWVYEQLTRTIWNIFFNLKDFRKNSIFLIMIWFWIISWIIIFANTISYLIDNFSIQTQLFFTWLIIWSIPFLSKLSTWFNSKSNFLLYLAWFIFVILFIFSWNYQWIENQINSNLFYNIKLFISWFIAAAAMIIPWFSWSMLLIIMWEYYNIIWFIKDFNLIKILILWIWVWIWIIVCAKIISHLLNKYNRKFYNLIIWMITASIFSVIPYYEIINTDIINLIYWFLFLITWIIISYFFWKINN